MSGFTPIKHGNVTDGWHAIEHKTFVQVYDPNCAPYMRLYKQSTNFAAAKAREFIEMLNQLGHHAAQKQGLEVAELKAELADLEHKAASRIAELREESDTYMYKARRTETQLVWMRALCESQAEAVKNMSAALKR